MSNKKEFISKLPKEENGYYITCNTLKSFEYGEYIQIKEFNSPISHEQRPENGEFAMQKRFHIYIDERVSETSLDRTTVHYLRLDGIPFKDSLWNLYKVR